MLQENTSNEGERIIAFKAELLDELDSIHSKLSICEAAVDNSDYLDINKEIAAFIGEINSKVSMLMERLESY